MSDFLSNKKTWINKICKMAYEGEFEKAQNVIDSGKNNGFILTKKDASEIITCCGIDITYSFIKPLVKLGGKIPRYVIKSANEFLSMWTTKKEENIWNNKNNDKMKNFLDDRIKGCKFVIKISKKTSKKTSKKLSKKLKKEFKK